MIHIICFVVWVLTLMFLLYLRYKYFPKKSVFSIVFFSALGVAVTSFVGWFIFFILILFIELVAQEPVLYTPLATEYLEVWLRFGELVLVFLGGLFGPLWQINRELDKAEKKGKQF
ncbi:MAG: hypothetical protein WCW78_01670 [Candidatus Paceibacterota bacterium]